MRTVARTPAAGLVAEPLSVCTACSDEGAGSVPALCGGVSFFAGAQSALGCRFFAMALSPRSKPMKPREQLSGLAGRVVKTELSRSLGCCRPRFLLHHGS